MTRTHSRLTSLQRAVLFAWGLGLLFVAFSFLLYPAWVTLRAIHSTEIRERAQAPTLVSDFETTARRYRAWAERYLARETGAKANSEDVALTEWPMFGSVFFLVAADDLAREGRISATGEMREAIDLAARVVTHPSTATWVRVKWGSSYLERENVFYRMLLVLGLSSYESLTGAKSFAPLLRTQSEALSKELLAAPLHLANDYPEECYPNDVLWTVAALKRASKLGYGSEQDVDALSQGLFATLDGPALTQDGLPAFRVEAATGEAMQPARGSGNSGILSMTAELSPSVAQRWFSSYAKNYWKDGWVQGFRETPPHAAAYEDVDSGPIVFGVGSVATGFGVGAARSVGRFDLAVPLAMETVPASWPTPFGLLLPGTLGWVAADGWCFGELALHFSMTRPTKVDHVVPYGGGVPNMVWVFMAFFISGAATCGWLAFRSLRLAWRGFRVP